MKVVVVGQNGFVGSSLVKYLKEKGLEVVGTSSKAGEGDLQLDLLNVGDFDFEVVDSGDCVIFAAGVSSPDACEKRDEVIYAINVLGTIEAIRQFLEKGARVMFFSSDLVYGSSDEGEVFKETSMVKPLMEYAKMKHEVEKMFLGKENFVTLRMSYVFSRFDKFTKYLTKCAKNGDLAEIFHPIYRNVVYLGDVLAGIERLVMNESLMSSGILNLCGEESLSRMDLADQYKEVVDGSLEYKLVDPPENFFKVRPRKIVVDFLHFSKILDRKLSSIVEAMRLEFNS